MSRRVCSSCKENVEPVAPRTAWKLVTIALWFTTLAVGMFFAILLGLNIVLVPVCIAIGLSVGEAAHRAASWTCPSCHAELAPPPEITERPHRHGGLVAHPA